LRAAAEASDDRELVLAGSQSLFGHTDQVPVETLMSEECGLWSRPGTEKLTVIVEKLGKGSPYHLAHGVYVDAVDPEMVLLPVGWEQRLKPMRLGEVTAWCLDVNDLVVSKLNAGRLKDYEFINAVLRAALAIGSDREAHQVSRICTNEQCYSATANLRRACRESIYSGAADFATTR
jgi:hypothetical protein